MYEGNLIKGTEQSAGYDLQSTEELIIAPGTRELVGTGVVLKLDKGTFGLIKSRSGLSVKGIDVGAGVIDSDYRGEVKVLICNNGKQNFAISPGNRIAQLIILPCLNILPATQTIEKDNLHAGFGSTGF